MGGVFGLIAAVILIGWMLWLVTNGDSGTTDGRRVSREQFGEAWPLTVDHGWVICRRERGQPAAIFRDPRGKEWAVNGAAIQLGYPEIEPIWAWNEDKPGARKSLILTELALEQCGR